MWVWAEGGAVNCDYFRRIKVMERQDGVFLVMGISSTASVQLSEHKTKENADAALRTLVNRFNRERK